MAVIYEVGTLYAGSTESFDTLQEAINHAQSYQLKELFDAADSVEIYETDSESGDSSCVMGYDYNYFLCKEVNQRIEDDAQIPTETLTQQPLKDTKTMTRQELIEAIREYRAQGINGHQKLNVSTELLQAEYDRMLAIWERENPRDDNDTDYTWDDLEADLAKGIECNDTEVDTAIATLTEASKLIELEKSQRKN